MQTARPIRFLAILASPQYGPSGRESPQGPPLDIAAEWRMLREAIEQAHSLSDNPIVHWIGRLLHPQGREVLRTILRARFDILHLGLHVDDRGVCLEDELASELPLCLNDFVEQVRGMGLQMVVFLCCNSISIATTLVNSGVVPFAIAARNRLSDMDAKRFCESFYALITIGIRPSDAFDQAERRLEARHNLVRVGDVPWDLPSPTIPPPAPIFSRYLDHNSLFPIGQAAELIGRRRDLAVIGKWLASGHRGMMLHGLGWVGKTTLAVAAALRYAHRFRAVAFASAKDRPTFGLKDVLQALNEALRQDLSREDEDDVLGAIIQRLNEGRVLMILDNLETVPDDLVKTLADALYARLEPDGLSRILLTSRHPRQFLLPDGLVAPEDFHEVNPLEIHEAVALLYCACGKDASDGDSPLALDELDVLRSQARLPTVYPLSAVARLRDLAQAAFRIPGLLRVIGSMAAQHGFHFAQDCLNAIQPRSKTLAAPMPKIADAMEMLIGQVVDSLKKQYPEAPDVLYAALPFVGGAEAAQLLFVLLGRATLDNPEHSRMVATRLHPAVEAGLLKRQDLRYELEPPVRAYLEHVRPLSPQKRALLSFYHALVWCGESTPSGVGVQKEWGNISAALDWLADRVAADPATAAESAKLLVTCVLGLRKVLIDGEAVRRLVWLEAAAEAAVHLRDLGKAAEVQETLADVHWRRGDKMRARAAYERALDGYCACQSILHEARVLKKLGDVLWSDEDLQAARGRYTEAQDRFRQAHSLGQPDQIGLATTLQALGNISLAELDRTKAQQAVDLYNEAREILEAQGDRRGLAQALLVLAGIHLISADSERARGYLSDAEKLLTYDGEG